jgi:hypothetical protein
MNTFLALKFRILTALIFAAALLTVSGQSAIAQMSENTPPSLVQHLRSDLKSDDAAQREHALVDIIALASCTDVCTVNFRSISEKKLSIDNKTGTGHVVELNALVPDLLKTYRSGPADGHRLLALSALINIGNEEALEQLVDEGGRQSKAITKATQRSLAAFYLEKYPELAERTTKTKRLSLDDVRRAKAVRVRQVRN